MMGNRTDGDNKLPLKLLELIKGFTQSLEKVEKSMPGKTHDMPGHAAEKSGKE